MIINLIKYIYNLFTGIYRRTQNKIKEVLNGGVLVPESVIVALWTDYLIANFTGKQMK